MIARTDILTENHNGIGTDVWARLAAPLSGAVISWRQDGTAVARDGKYFARFVCYIEANTVRERLDTVVPGEWDLTLELLPKLENSDDETSHCAFKARLQILGVIREDVGTGRDYKQASTDAFKRAAVRFGIGHELYSYEQNWIEMDGDGKYAKPVEDPQMAYTRRYGNGGSTVLATQFAAPMLSTNPAHSMLTDMEQASCPKCGGRMWDNRMTKRNPKAPDFKCRSRSCDGVIWPVRAEQKADEYLPEQKEAAVPTGVAAEDELPF